MVEDPSHDEALDEVELDEDDEEAVVLSDDALPARTVDVTEVDVESIEDTIAKKEAIEEPEDDDEPGISLTREERVEPLSVKVIPPQPTEFICKRCFLVKHRSQLKDKSKGLCRDCA